MQRITRLILSVLLIAAVFSGAAVSAAATNLPAGMLIGDENGISVSVDGEYFISAEDLEAGDVITKKLTILNTENYSYDLTMTAEPLEETGPLKLLDEVRCTLKLDGKVLYDGRVRGDEGINMIKNALDLGTYKSGDRKTLDITLTVNPKMQKTSWNVNEAFFKWNFYAAHDVQKDPPKTGEIIKDSLYIVLPIMVMIMGILLLFKQRRNEKTYGGE